MASISVICHEFGHLLGLPDLYTRPEDPATEGLGIWCTMSNGHGRDGKPLHLSAWCKERLGWLRPAVLDPRVRQKLQLSPIEGTAGQCYKVLIRADGSELHLVIARAAEPTEKAIQMTPIRVLREAPIRLGHDGIPENSIARCLRSQRQVSSGLDARLSGRSRRPRRTAPACGEVRARAGEEKERRCAKVRDPPRVEQRQCRRREVRRVGGDKRLDLAIREVRARPNRGAARERAQSRDVNRTRSRQRDSGDRDRGDSREAGSDPTQKTHALHLSQGTDKRRAISLSMPHFNARASRHSFPQRP